MQFFQLRPGLFCVVFVALIPAIGRTQVQDASTQRPALPPAPKTQVLEYPLVMRLDHSALDSLAVPDIDEQGQIDKVVLGTHVVGKSRARGSMSVLLIPDRDNASFNLALQGKMSTSTVGTNGPAVIYCRTKTDFDCTRHVTYDPTQGFTAGASSIESNTQLSYDGFGSRGRFGHRLIQRIAKRRSAKSREQMRRLTERDAERDLLAGFDKKVDEQLTTLNQMLDIALYKKLFVGEDFPIQMAAQSSKECIHIGLGKEESTEQIIATLPQRNLFAPIEIWVHTKVLGESMTDRLKQIEDWRMLPQIARLEVLEALLLPSTESERLVDLTVQGDWAVFGLQMVAIPTGLLTNTHGDEQTAVAGNHKHQ